MLHGRERSSSVKVQAHAPEYTAVGVLLDAVSRFLFLIDIPLSPDKALAGLTIYIAQIQIENQYF